MAQESNEPRIQIDSDWKAQAQAEKERLAKQEAEREAKAGPRGGPGELPPADFRSLVGILASQAMSGLGAYGDEKGRVIVDPIGAKFAIDLLGVLEEKTRNNLSSEEQADIQGVLQELRVRFVQIVEMLARQSAGGVGAGGAPPLVTADEVSGASPARPAGGAPPKGGGPAGGPAAGDRPRIVTP